MIERLFPACIMSKKSVVLLSPLSARVLSLQSARIYRFVRQVLPGASLVMAIGFSLAACGQSTPQRAELPQDQYFEWAIHFARIEHCTSTNRLSVEDSVALRRTLNENLSQYTFDGAEINRITQEMLTRRPQIEADPARRREMAEVCEHVRQVAASNRAVLAQNREEQLHRAQLAAAQAQARAAQSTNWQPQPFIMPQLPTYQPPQVQTPQLGGGSNYFYCNRLGSHVVTCR